MGAVSVFRIIDRQIIDLYLFSVIPSKVHFWIISSFLFVIHSGSFASSKHPFILIASLSWIEVNFWNQNPWMPSWLEVLQFGILDFLSLFLKPYICVKIVRIK